MLIRTEGDARGQDGKLAREIKSGRACLVSYVTSQMSVPNERRQELMYHK
jgi:hypothetical protein